jgi:hypothetical protein
MRRPRAVLLLAGALIIGGLLVKSPSTHGRPVVNVLAAQPVASGQEGEYADRRLRAAADELLAAINPNLPGNAYFTDFAREKLRWMNREYVAGRLDLSFISETGARFPKDVVMASTRVGDKSTILIAKARFADFLSSGPALAPFTQRQRNDFALALIHEIVHLQNPDATPHSAADYAREEFRAWRDVSRHVVRALRAVHQPMHQTFIDVDDALLNCRDQAPCPQLERMVRLRVWSAAIQ